MGSLENKIAIVTGGGRGIGAATADVLAKNGAKVVLVSRTKKQLEDVANQISNEYGGDKASIHVANISQENEVVGLFKKVKSQMGPVDILINNAGFIRVSDFIDTEVSDWDQTINVNLKGSFLCAREAFKQMKDSGNGGSIVNISSLSGIRGTEKFKGLSAYSVSKHGVVGLTESMAVEAKEFGIRVNCVAPGAVDTQMLKEAAPFLKTETKPADIAKVIFYLADSDQSGVLNGAVIEVHSNS